MSLAGESAVVPVVMPLAHPLDEFYAHARMPLPEIVSVEGAAVPEPYRRLLVHDGDMTPALERFHETRIHLRVLGREQRANNYFRQVLLMAEDDGPPLEFGAIKIYLELLPPAARQEILGERLPLGTILARHKIPHLSRPKAYLQVRADPFIAGLFEVPVGTTLYGRRNTLSTPARQSLAEVVEILPALAG